MYQNFGYHWWTLPNVIGQLKFFWGPSNWKIQQFRTQLRNFLQLMPSIEALWWLINNASQNFPSIDFRTAISLARRVFGLCNRPSSKIHNLDRKSCQNFQATTDTQLQLRFVHWSFRVHKIGKNYHFGHYLWFFLNLRNVLKLFKLRFHKLLQLVHVDFLSRPPPSLAARTLKDLKKNQNFGNHWESIYKRNLIVWRLPRDLYAKKCKNFRHHCSTNFNLYQQHWSFSGNLLPMVSKIYSVST